MTGSSLAIAVPNEQVYVVSEDATGSTTNKAASGSATKDLDKLILADKRTTTYRILFTDAQLLGDLQNVAKARTITYVGVSEHPWADIGQSSIGILPRKKIVTSFEPHLRQATVKKLRVLVDEFALAIGHPEAAVVMNELKSELTETYKRSIGSPETRNFASAISILQDFLRPHWSMISSDKLRSVSERLDWLGAQDKVDARLLNSFFSDIRRILGGRMFFESTEDLSEPEPEED
jgi:hypothetical protein